MKESKSLFEIMTMVKKHAGMILSLTIFSVLVSAIASFYFITPVYQASTQILVNQNRSGAGLLDDYDIQTDLRLIQTYSVIIKSPVILDRVIEQMDLNLTNVELNEKINVATAEDSQVVSIAVKDSDSSHAVMIVNTIASVFQEEIKGIMSVDNVQILSPAVERSNPVPVEPRPLLNIAVAAFLGLSVGVGIAFLLTYLDTTIKNDEDVEEILSIPVLGLIPTIAEDEKSKKAIPIALKRKET